MPSRSRDNHNLSCQRRNPGPPPSDRELDQLPCRRPPGRYPDGQSRLSLTILAGNVVLTPQRDAQTCNAGSFSVAAYRIIVEGTLPGAFPPVGPANVFGTDAPLAVTPTIRVSAEEDGGSGGQVIATPRDELTTSLAGFLYRAKTRKDQIDLEPPLSQQRSTMNEESLLD